MATDSLNLANRSSGSSDTENEPSITLNEKKLEEYFWIPLEELGVLSTATGFDIGEEL
ncbi:MAG: hypothetical protein ABSG57_07785 [Candidatus Bathyarchaeia archaeon]